MIKATSTEAAGGGRRGAGVGGRKPRVRMDVRTRREKLLEAGAVLFAERLYDEVEIGDIADAVGVSRGLLYHYFPDKATFFLAVMARLLDALAEATRVEPADSTQTRAGVESRESALRTGLDAYFDFIASHPQWYRSIYRSTVSTNVAASELVNRAHARQAEQILALFPELEPTPLRRVAMRGWVSFLATVGMSWLDGAEVARGELRECCLEVLASSLGGVASPTVLATGDLR